ncbi:hypothetical protein Peur_011176 [Populus x canadensis]
MNSAVWILLQAASGWNSFDQMLMQVAYGKKKDCSVSDVNSDGRNLCPFTEGIKTQRPFYEPFLLNWGVFVNSC